MTSLPAPLQRQFDGDDLAAKTSICAILSTVDGDGWPHLSFLSAGEVMMAGDKVALTIWDRAHSAAALRQQRRGVLFAAADGGVIEVRLDVADVSSRMDGTALVLARADALREHKAPYAVVEQLIGFRLDDPTAAVARWETQVGAMRAALATMDAVAIG